MAKKIGIGVLVVVLVVSIAGAFWVRSVFAADTVRVAVASQISSALGQPVSIGGIGASFFPRITVRLSNVTIGEPVRIQAETLRLGTDLKALFSRRIVHGSVRIDGARVQLPLPPLGSTTSSTSNASSGPPVEIVSIDEVVVNGVEIVSGGRVLRGDLEAVPHGAGATLRKVSLSAEDTRLTGSGDIADLAGPVGDITIKAETLNLTRLLDFLTSFSSGTAMTGSETPSRPAAKQTPTNLTLSFTAEKATMGTLALGKLSAQARVTQAGVTLNPLEFGVFGGHSKGTTTLTTAGATPIFRLGAVLSNIDVAAATAFAGYPETISGQMSGQIDVSGRSADAAGLMNTATGTARVDIRDGVVKNLGLVKTIVIATSMRSDAQMPSSTGGSNDERFTQLGATLRLANGAVRTNDLQFVSPDVLMRAGGSIRLDGSAIDLSGDVQLSEALTQQAGRDLIRYTQEQGRVTLPVMITGTAQAPSVRVDMASLANRALQNKAKEELQKALGRIIK